MMGNQSLILYCKYHLLIIKLQYSNYFITTIIIIPFLTITIITDLIINFYFLIFKNINFPKYFLISSPSP